MNETIKMKIIRIISDRLFILFAMVIIMFGILIVRLFSLQIVNGEKYLADLSVTSLKHLEIPAPRGAIYDKYGRPMAVNKSAYSVKLDPSVQVEDLNAVLYNLIVLFDKNGEEIVDDFPISETKPYTFEFGGNETSEELWKNDMNVKLEYNETETIEYLIEKFDIPVGLSREDVPLVETEIIEYLVRKFNVPPGLTEEEIFQMVALNSMVYMQRYQQYKSITIAFDVKAETVVAIEENSDDYQGVYIDVEPLREYPGGPSVSHLIGYTGKINAEELSEHEEGYTSGNQIGKTGLEKAFESDFKGVSGERLVEVNSNGRPLQTIETTMPVQGSDLYTTIDLELNDAIYEILENTLEDILIGELLGQGGKHITEKDMFASMIQGNTISTEEIMASADGISLEVKDYVLSYAPDIDIMTDEGLQAAKDIIETGIREGHITSRNMLVVMYEQGIITANEELKQDFVNGNISSLQIIIDKIESGEITPQMTNLDPCTGSVVVVDVDSGDVLAAVNYPTYDNNMFANSIDSEYYKKVNNDPTNPLINRAFMEARAPGSTFKMITAITGLETGTITPSTEVYDEISFEKSGPPYPRCWSSVSHGSINVSEALKHSCNYFFMETTYRIGNAEDGNPDDSINALNKYMELFGLNTRSGVEIGEYRDTVPDDILAISSPMYKEYKAKLVNPDIDPKEYAWNDGDTVRTAFGQASNEYTSAVMCKYIATIANDGLRYSLHLMDNVKSKDGVIKEYTPILEEEIVVGPKTWEAVDEGMLMVTGESGGTAYSVFKDFPITVAGKTGTAQQDSKRNDHSTFGGYAPYENPEIAVYVAMPFSDTKIVVAPAAKVARDVMDEYFGLSKEAEMPEEINALAK